jgi:hypothetical protein
MPARISVDIGHDGKQQLAELDAGVTLLQDILGERGKKIKQHIRKKQKEQALWAEAGLGKIGTQPEAKPEEDDDDDPEAEAAAK